MRIPEKEQTDKCERGRGAESWAYGRGRERHVQTTALDLGQCNQKESNLTAPDKRGGGQCARPQSSQEQFLLDLEDKKEVDRGWVLEEKDSQDWSIVEDRTVTENS